MWYTYLRFLASSENSLAAWKVSVGTLNPLQSPRVGFTTPDGKGPLPSRFVPLC